MKINLPFDGVEVDGIDGVDLRVAAGVVRSVENLGSELRKRNADNLPFTRPRRERRCKK